MADVSANLKDWSTTAGSNSPSDSTVIGAGLADNLQQIQATVRQDLAHKGADILSAGTTDLGAVAGSMHDITGSNAITSFGTVSAGIRKTIKFEGALTLTHNATSLITPSGANITTADGDTAEVISEGSGNWRVLSYAGRAAHHTDGNFSGSVTITGGAGGASLTLPATGRLFLDGGSNTYIHESSGDTISLVAGGAEQVRISSTASAVNYVVMSGAATAGSVSIGASGTDSDVALNIYSRGTDPISLFTNSGSVEQVRVAHTASANRYITLTGSNGGNPTIATSAGSLAITPTVVAAGGVTLSTTAGDTALNRSKETTISSTASGPFANEATTLSVSRVGNMVTLTFPAVRKAGNSVGTTIALTALAAEYRPVTSVYSIVPLVTDNGSDQSAPGIMNVSAAGVITIYRNVGLANFTATAGTVGYYGFSVSWEVA